MKKKFFITGGSGVLGKKLSSELQKEFDIYVPTKKECDILNISNLTDLLIKYNPDYVIHLAAYVDTFGCEQNKDLAMDVNITGTINIVKACEKIKCKLIYISSEYVFSGEKGNYTIFDRLNPINVYGKTKAAAEYIVSIYDNHQIIRMPFIKKIYNKVFIDQYSTRSFLEDVIGRLIQNIINNDEKIIQIASEKLSLYELYKKKGIDAEPISISNLEMKILPKDTSLINFSL